MAGIAYVQIRLWNPGRDCIYGDETNVLNYLQRPYMDTGKNLRHFEINWTSVVQAASEELGTAATSDKDGTTTPYQLTIVSTDAKDTVAGVGARRVAAIGVSVSSIGAYNSGEQPKLTVEVIDTKGTTDVLSTRYYLWTVHPYVCDVGSEHDTAGTLTVESPANTNLYVITAGQIESEGGTLKFAEGDLAKLDVVRVGPTATLAAGDGGALEILSTGFEGNVLLTDDDFKTDYYCYIHYGAPVEVKNAWTVGKYATKAAKMKFSAADTANTPTLKIHATVLVGKKV